MTEPNRQSGEKEERIIEIEIERLRPFKEHPFQVKDDKEMFLLQESIEKYGILNPLIVRPVPDGSQIEVFENVIPMSVKAAETSAEGKSIYMHCPKGKVAEAYMNLTQEVLKNEK